MDRRSSGPWFLFLALILAPAAVFPQRGLEISAAAAEFYVLRAREAIGEGRWDGALALLERGADFADASSDLSYLLAEVRYHENLPLPLVLDSLRLAFDTDRWERYAPSWGRLLEAEALICLRNYSAALRVLDLAEGDPLVGPGPGRGADPPRGGTAAAPRTGGQYAAVLRLLALKGLAETGEFLRFLGQVMDRYPRDPRPLEILFSWAAGRMPEDGRSAVPADRPPVTDRSLVDLALRRLPLLLEGDSLPEGRAPSPEAPPGSRLRGSAASSRLAWLAAPLIRDADEARRLVSAYRAEGRPDKESLPISLDLGLIDDGRAVEELFESGDAPGILDKDSLRRVWSLLRGPEGRDLFHRRLLEFSGLIVTDADGDGLGEEWVSYSSGRVLEYRRDADQDRQDDLRVGFSADGLPLWAEEGGIRVDWEQYPSVLQAELGGTRYIPAPQTLFYAPLRLVPLTGEAPAGGFSPGPGPLHPEEAAGRPRLTERVLLSSALRLVRPSAEFPGGLEYVELDRGLPLRAEEILEGKTVSVTEFVLGQPRLQRLDLDLDGRLETIRRFREGTDPRDPVLESLETDGDRDGLYEMGEYFFPDGSGVYRWDSDGDGIPDYSETRGNSH